MYTAQLWTRGTQEQGDGTGRTRGTQEQGDGTGRTRDTQEQGDGTGMNPGTTVHIFLNIFSPLLR